MAKSWDRYPKEPNQWFDRFTKLRLMGPNRSLLAAFRNERLAAGKSGHVVRVPGAWNTNAIKWKWLERAEAWDQEQRELEEKQALRDLEKARRHRVEVLMGGRGFVIKWLSRMLERVTKDPKVLDSWDFDTITLAMVRINRELRAEYEIEARQYAKAAVPSAMGPASTPLPLDLSKLTDEELAVVEAVFAKAIAADDLDDELSE